MRLLSRTLLNLSVYSVIILILVTPVFYRIINRIIWDEVDENLFLQKNEIQIRINRLKPDTDLLGWQSLDSNIKIEPISTTFFRDSLFTHQQYNSVTGETEPYRVLITSVIFQNKPYLLTARVSLLEQEDLIKALAVTQSIALVLLLAGMLVINWRNSSALWKPFYKTLDSLQKFELEKAKPLSFTQSKIKEFNDLNKAIAQLTARDHQVYRNQKEFTENASHEIQTPLAIVQSKMEMLMQTNLTKEQAGLMEEMMIALARLSRLNKGLLLLIKIDSLPFLEREKVNLKEFLEKLILVYQAEANQKTISFQVSLQHQEIFFNPLLLDILFSNLLSNAIRHTSPGNIISIFSSLQQITISNPGEALPFDPEKIFNRFQKGSSKSGAGIGLAIVKRIAETTGIFVQYEFYNHTHFFSIFFEKNRLSH
ncbi:MAG: hypothetical protein JST69_05025 [Bacteroidetes bacterium]|nr:hypothetical protein [Bacteroidota bacterium]